MAWLVDFLSGNDMKTKLSLFLSLALLASSSQAQLYKWVDASGRVTYSDMPPPPTAKQAQKKSSIGVTEDEVALPYSISSVSGNHPVVLYTSADCAPCEDGRALLKKRGIPFSERTIATDKDLAAMKQAGGSGNVPYVTVGRNGISGFEAGSWNSALTAAGYPESNRLPANYRQPQAQPAAPEPAAAKNETGAPGTASEPGK